VTFECQEELRALRTELLEKSEQDVVQEGKRILVATMQRLASKPNNDITAPSSAPSEEMKPHHRPRGAQHQPSRPPPHHALIDESPLMVLIAFDPVRREIAKLRWRAWSGRPHPPGQHRGIRLPRATGHGSARRPAGEEAVDQLKISGLHPEIIKLLGRLRFRFPTRRTSSTTPSRSRSSAHACLRDRSRTPRRETRRLLPTLASPSRRVRGQPRADRRRFVRRTAKPPSWSTPWRPTTRR